MDKPEMSVVLIDDDPHSRSVFQMVMDHHKLPLFMFDNAEDAIRHLHDHVPDIAVIDLFLPGLDGYQTLYRIQRDGIAPNCSFVATTAYYTNDTETETLSRGFDGYIAKPFNVENLVMYLAHIIEKRRSLGA